MHTSTRAEMLSLQRMWQSSKSQCIHLWSEEADLQTSHSYARRGAPRSSWPRLNPLGVSGSECAECPGRKFSPRLDDTIFPGCLLWTFALLSSLLEQNTACRGVVSGAGVSECESQLQLIRCVALGTVTSHASVSFPVKWWDKNGTD